MAFINVASLLVVLLLGTCTVHGLLRPKHDKVVACYVASWAAYRSGNGAFTLDNLRPEYCTHLIYTFAGVNATSWTIRSLDPWADMEKDGMGNYRKITALRQRHPGLKISLGVGGWNEGSKNYSTLSSSPDRRRTFIHSTVEFLKTYGFDGLDLDWEFPGSRGGAPYDKQNFVSLVKELRDAFREYRFILTAAISADKRTINEAYDIPEISKYLDYIHVMAYDYHGAWNRQVLPNTPLRSKDGLSVEDTVMHLLQQGAPAEKLILGLAMYGRTFVLTAVPERQTKESPFGLTSLETGFKGPYTSEDGFMGFNEICEALVVYPQNWTTGWDDYSSTAYAINQDHVVVYDNRKAMMIKVDYIKKHKLAGVMVWSIDTDDFRGKCAALHSDMDPLDGVDFPLMRSINIALANITKRPDLRKASSSAIQQLSGMVYMFSLAILLFFSFN